MKLITPQDPTLKRRLEFVVYCLEILAERLKSTPNEVYRRMARVGLAQDFIRRDDPLHTQSRDYVADEVILLLQRREAALAAPQPHTKEGGNA